MKKIIIAILISSLLVTNCAYNILKGENEREQNFYTKVNKVCEEKDELSIFTKDNKDYKANKLVMDIDTTSFFNLESKIFEKIGTDDIYKIEFTGTGTSNFEGLLFGGLAGGIVANILSNPLYGEAKQGKAIYILLGAIGGAIVGLLYTIINPGNTTILMTK